MADEDKKVKLFKKIVIFGATGQTGRSLLQQALDAGYRVTAVARTPEKLKSFNRYENFEVKQGDVWDRTTFQDCLADVDVVMSCLGPPSYVSVFQTTTFYTDSMKEIHEAMKAYGVSRFLAVSAWATQDIPSLPFFIRWIVRPLFLKSYLVNLNEMEQYLEKTELNYTICRPPGLTSDPPSGKEIMTEINGQFVLNAAMLIPRADVAAFMLHCLQSQEFDKKMLSLGIHN